jgi:sarcosine oxidase subunit beta
VFKNRSSKPAKYSAASLIWKGARSKDWPRVWRYHELEKSYDVVIIGGGVHGLACAYYLAKNHGITNVAVLDKSYLGSGGSGRNTAIVRSNYLTPEGVAFYDRSLSLYNAMSADLNLNVMFSERGHLTLAHTDSALRAMNWRAEVNKLQGIDSSVIDPAEVKKQAPSLDVSGDSRYPILGALYHPQAARSDMTLLSGVTHVAPITMASRCTRRLRCSTSSSKAVVVVTARD